MLEASDLVFDEITKTHLNLFKTKTLSIRTHADFPINKQAKLNVDVFDEFCSIWSMLAKNFHAKTNLNSTASDKQHFKKMKIQGGEFSDGLKNEEIPKIEPKNVLNLNLFELKVNDGKPKFLVLCFSEEENN